MRTRYEAHQGDFSYKAHLAARRQVYPLIFGTDEVSYEDVRLETSPRGKILDGELGVDVVARPSRPDLDLGPGRTKLNSRLHFYVQERFRRPRYRGYGDVTITEFNHASGEPSELYKIAAGLMLYGLYNESTGLFESAYAIDVCRTILALQRGVLPFTKERNRKAQDFVCLKLPDLARNGCLLWRLQDAQRRAAS